MSFVDTLAEIMFEYLNFILSFSYFISKVSDVLDEFVCLKLECNGTYCTS